MLFSLALLIALLYMILKQKEEKSTFLISGNTMGTSYNIKFIREPGKQTQIGIDSLLVIFNKSLSTYDPESELSRLNRDSIFQVRSNYLKEMLNRGGEYWDNTYGAFDPSVMPLVNFWGFGFEDRSEIDSSRIETILESIGFEKIQVGTDYLVSKQPSSMLDFSAIAKGYGVDMVADFLKERGYKNFMVEIGGEIFCYGLNANEDPWLIGIEDPSSLGQRKAHLVLGLSDKGMATSGNYRNFYWLDGKKVSHTIDPKTGYPAESDLLSVTVISKDCAFADAYATAFMVMGKDSAFQFSEKRGISAAFIFSDGEGILQTAYTSPFEELLNSN
jgi:FAD:protein FMN transferase